MIKLYDVFKASKTGIAPNIYTALIAKKLNGANAEKVLEGMPPLTYTANGEPLIEWRIYGNTGGVGDRTAQLYNNNGTDTDNGYLNNSYLDYNGNPAASSNHTVSEYIDVSEYEYITLSGVGTTSASVTHAFYDENKSKVSTFYNDVVPKTTSVPATAKYVRLTVANTRKTTLMLNAGSTALDHEAYGLYKTIISASGTALTPIYTSQPLKKSLDGTAVDTLSSTGLVTYNVDDQGQSQTATTETVTVPTITTTSGTNTLSVNTTVQPSKMYIKYK